MNGKVPLLLVTSWLFWLLQAAEIENLKQEKEKVKQEKEKLRQEKLRLVEDKGSLQNQTEKLAEESAYAKELASQAAVELKNLAEEVTKLSFQNAKLQNDLMLAQEVTFQNAKLQSELTKLQSELTKTQETAFALAAMKSQAIGRSKAMANGDLHEGETNLIGRGTSPRVNGGGNNLNRGGGNMNVGNRNGKFNNGVSFFDDIDMWQHDSETSIDEVKMELELSKEKEATLLATMAERELALQKKLDGAKQRETNLENDLASMWVLVAKLKKEKEAAINQFSRTEFQDTYQEDFQTNGRILDSNPDLEDDTVRSSSNVPNDNDVEVLIDPLARTELHESYGNEFWSNGGEATTLDQEELYSGYPDSTFPSLAKSTSFGSVDHQPATDGGLDIVTNPFAEKHEPNVTGAKEGKGTRSLEELKSFMEEERRRGSELGTLVSQLKASPVPSAATNPFLMSHHTVDKHSISTPTSSDFAAEVWPPFESSSYYKSWTCKRVGTEKFLRLQGL